MRNKGEGYVVANGERTIEDDRWMIEGDIWTIGWWEDGFGFVAWIFNRWVAENENHYH